MKRHHPVSLAPMLPQNAKPKQGRWLLALTLFLYTVTSGPPTAFAQAANPAAAGYRSDRILVKPKEGTPLAALTAFHQQSGAQVLRTFARIQNWQVLQLPPGADVQAMLALYRQSGLVAFAEPDFTVQALMEPNDFRYVDGSLWGLRNTGLYGGTAGMDIHAAQGWDTQNTASNVIVAVVDTGVRYTHEDLAENMWVNPGEIPGNGVDDDGDGFVDDVYGINAITGSGDPFDDHGHGTHVSGTIGALGNNSVGVVGVCWRAQIMACKFINPQGDGSISDAITCIDYARNKGAKIINASWGGYAFTSAALLDAINGIRDAGIIFVAACGNSAIDNDVNPLFPASYNYDNIIAVAATDRTGNRAFFSNFGKTTVDLGVPGMNIFSCWNTSDASYQYYDGTSMAAPHVAGACALVWAHYPNLTHQQVIKRVLQGTDPMPDLAGKCVTGGCLSLPRALREQPLQGYTPATIWVDDALPGGAVPHSEGGSSWSGEPWNWVTNNPPPFSGAAAHQSVIITGIHEHHFDNATETLEVSAGDLLFAYVYLDPENPPRQVMLQWADSCWEHRAFWGENLITWGAYGTSSRRDMGGLPPVGQWVRLDVPANLLGLEGATLKGMSFILVDGRAAWDSAGREPVNSPSPGSVMVLATGDMASEAGDTGTFTISRGGDTASAVTVNYTLSGSAENGADYDALPTSVTIPEGAASTVIVVAPFDDAAVEGDETVVLTLSAGADYTIGSPDSATVTIMDHDQPPPTVTILAADDTATEGSSDTAVFTITRTGSTAMDLTVNLVPSGTATKWDDYRRPQGDMPDSWTIPAGASSITITVVAADDPEAEGTETATLTIQPDSAYEVGTPNSVTITIFDNDEQPVVTLQTFDPTAAETGPDPGVIRFHRTGDVSQPLTVNWTFSGTAVNGVDYQQLPTTGTIPAGMADADLPITPIDDSEVEGDETVVVTVIDGLGYTAGSPSSATVTITDNDP